jgi:hypothetical protein
MPLDIIASTNLEELIGYDGPESWDYAKLGGASVSPSLPMRTSLPPTHPLRSRRVFHDHLAA